MIGVIVTKTNQTDRQNKYMVKYPFQFIQQVPSFKFTLTKVKKINII